MKLEEQLRCFEDAEVFSHEFQFEIWLSQNQGDDHVFEAVGTFFLRRTTEYSVKFLILSYEGLVLQCNFFFSARIKSINFPALQVFFWVQKSFMFSNPVFFFGEQFQDVWPSISFGTIVDGESQAPIWMIQTLELSRRDKFFLHF